MARLPRLYAPGIPHYVVQRAAAGRVLFVDDADYRTFTTLLGDTGRASGIALHAYVLLPGEIRLVATAADASAVPSLMQALGRRYVPLANRRSGRDGPLWDRRYRSTLVDPDAFVIASMLHVEQRPVRAGLADAPGQWRWSSHRHHAGLEQQSLVADHASYWALSNTPFERQALYREAAEATQADALADRIERAVERGWALGDVAFLARIADTCNRRASPLPRGRPRRQSVPI